MHLIKRTRNHNHIVRPDCSVISAWGRQIQWCTFSDQTLREDVSGLWLIWFHFRSFMTKAVVLVNDCPWTGSGSTAALLHYCFNQFISDYMHKSNEVIFLIDTCLQSYKTKKAKYNHSFQVGRYQLERPELSHVCTFINLMCFKLLKVIFLNLVISLGLLKMKETIW